MRRWRRGVARVLRYALAGFALLVAVVMVQGWTAFGRSPSGEQLRRLERSPQWKDGAFANPEPLWNDWWRAIAEAPGSSPHATPREPVPVVRATAADYAKPPASGLRVSWLGHSTILVELDGMRLLVDPVWSERASPLTWIGPKRWYPPPIALGELPAIDAVLISHDHYDHLDYETITAIKRWNATFIAPLGVGSHLTYWGIPEERIRELDWWDRTELGALEVVATPARHASGRLGTQQNQTLWAGYAILGATRRVYYSGDTGLFPAMREIGERLGPFDVAMIEAGAYGQAWPDWHLGPEQAVRAHRMVRGELLLPVHWGAFDLALHGWTEPAERVLAASRSAGVRVALPRPGQSFEPTDPPTAARWWPELPWRSAVQYPILSTKVD